MLVVGLGSPILGDDGVGLEVVRRLRGLVPNDGRVVLEEDAAGGLRLMERMIGYRRAIVVDAAVAGGPAGAVTVLTPDGLPTWNSGSAHDATLPAALAWGRRLGAVLPKDEAIRIVAVEAGDVTTFAEHCTPAVEAAIPVAVARVLELLGDDDRGPAETGRRSES